ncbi:uncharacterized protein LOC129763132 isoform X2 [Toxorhynchites rutilus septentrionalis]|uniref:uncharacterized protein LOC129763132 isoform X2 n=1 Tax=Toxorhynchites rutilus septentrionalis TaxID=329112 RepID=UPI002478F8D0|nr:uncharacterized protein LOC129763132 isoform X2 [Toxorhynchites rutilus septentrionalis]
MAQPRESSLLSGIQAVRLFWSVHSERRRSSQLSQLERASSDSVSCEELHRTSGNKFCRICRLSDDLLMENVCECKGTIGHIHERCLRTWTVYQRSQRCEICRTKFRFDFERKLTNWQLAVNFVRRRYFWIMVRDVLNFMVLFGISVLQNAAMLAMVQEEVQPSVPPVLALAIGASFFNFYFTRWIMNRALKAYNLVRQYWILTHDEEFVGYFNEDYALFGENQSEIENMLLAEYDAPEWD